MSEEKSSELHKFYAKNLEERLSILKEFSGLSEEELNELRNYGSLDFEKANRMIGNVIGSIQFPLGIATNFMINGKDYLIPMAIEEPSVIAAASKAAGIARKAGGFKAESKESIMIGQIQLKGIKDFSKAKKEILKKKKELLEKVNSIDKVLIEAGGGAREIEVREIGKGKKKFLVIHLLVDVRDAMGANTINSMCEKIAPEIEEISNGKAGLRILSNLAVHRTVKARAVFTKKALEESFKGQGKGGEIIKGIIDAAEFAEADAFRACTHNKGIMNGVDAVAVATGNDFRAIEAAVHAFSCWKNKGYKPLSKYYKDKKEDLVGEIELPLALGIVGGATKTNPVAGISLKILGVKSARELAEVIACVGLANNFAALRALATEGIQKGHMKLHAKNIAIMAGANGKEVERVAEKMVKEKDVSVGKAKEIMNESG
ncbi:MAG: hydroxymethylglutaryl-CoA reductase, degradative [archaeon]|nr:hydroxymethylglutaryl-CoA reductase, degradative [Candidatus Micrarchaeota archaeon]